jgi:hypothetical protein
VAEGSDGEEQIREKERREFCDLREETPSELCSEKECRN